MKTVKGNFEELWEKMFPGTESMGTLEEFDKFLDELLKDQPAINILANAVNNAEMYLDGVLTEDEEESTDLEDHDVTIYMLRYCMITAMERLAVAEHMTGLMGDGMKILKEGEEEIKNNE